MTSFKNLIPYYIGMYSIGTQFWISEKMWKEKDVMIL